MSTRIARNLAALGIALGNLWHAGCAHAQPPTDPQQAGRYRTLQAAGPQTALVIYPVRVLGQPSRNVADALGLVLEKHGMTNLEAVDTPFAMPEGTAWDDAPARFEEFLHQNPTRGAYALYAEYLGEPKSGPTEVRWLIAEASGALVFSDRQTPNDADFRKTAGRDPDPLGCSALVASRVFSQLEWKKSAPPADGKFARLWAEKSGTPSDAERAAMTQRAAKLRTELRTARLAVFATRVNLQSDAESGERLARLLTERLSCAAKFAGAAPAIEIAPSSNQQKRLWDLARGLRASLRTNPVDADYVVLAEYLIEPASATVRCVHVVVCDRAGEWVLADLQNDQQDDYRRIRPKTAGDCDRLAVERMARALR